MLNYYFETNIKFFQRGSLKLDKYQPSIFPKPPYVFSKEGKTNTLYSNIPIPHQDLLQLQRPKLKEKNGTEFGLRQIEPKYTT